MSVMSLPESLGERVNVSYEPPRLPGREGLMSVMSLPDYPGGYMPPYVASLVPWWVYISPICLPGARL